jgi:excisionase family DNA binding protein
MILQARGQSARSVWTKPHWHPGPAKVANLGTQFYLRQSVARVMTVGEIAQYFGIPKKRVYEMLRREADAGFPCFRIGRGWRVDIEQMREWMCQRIEEQNSVKARDQ